MQKGQTCVASSGNRGYKQTEYSPASMESGSSAEESSSMGLHIPISAEPAIWEGWTASHLECSSTMETSNSISSLEYLEHSFPQPDLVSTWSMGKSTPYMEHLRQSTGARESYEIFSPTRLTSGTRLPGKSSSGGPDQSSEVLSAYGSSASSSQHSGDSYLGHYAAAESYDLHGKALDGCSQFSSYGSKATGATHISVQFPISPESPISPLDLHNAVQQLSRKGKGQPESAWADLAGLHSETSAMHLAYERDLPSNQLLSDSLHYSRRPLFSESMSIEGYNDFNNQSGDTNFVEEISSQFAASHLDILAQKYAGPLGSNADGNLLAPNFGSSSGWSQILEMDPTPSRRQKSIPSSVHCPGGDMTSWPSIQQPPQRRQADQTFSVVTTSSSILDANPGNDDQPGTSLKARVNSGKRLTSLEPEKPRDRSGPPPSKQKCSERFSAWRKSSRLEKVEPAPSASAASYSATQTAEVIAAGPALNTNGKPRAKRGSATDPQSVYARNRRKRLDERLKTLANLVPNGTKVDLATMLDEAFHYVKLLERQVQILESDDLWLSQSSTDTTTPHLDADFARFKECYEYPSSF